MSKNTHRILCFWYYFNFFFSIWKKGLCDYAVYFWVLYIFVALLVQLLNANLTTTTVI